MLGGHPALLCPAAAAPWCTRPHRRPARCRWRLGPPEGQRGGRQSRTRAPRPPSRRRRGGRRRGRPHGLRARWRPARCEEGVGGSEGGSGRGRKHDGAELRIVSPIPWAPPSPCLASIQRLQARCDGFEAIKDVFHRGRRRGVSLREEPSHRHPAMNNGQDTAQGGRLRGGDIGLTLRGACQHPPKHTAQQPANTAGQTKDASPPPITPRLMPRV